MCVVNIAEVYLAPLPTGGRGGQPIHYIRYEYLVNHIHREGRGGKGCRYRDA